MPSTFCSAPPTLTPCRAVQDAQMAHNLERLRHAAVDGLVRTANAAPSKRLGTIFLVLNFTHAAQVRACAPRQHVCPASLVDQPSAAAHQCSPAKLRLKSSPIVGPDEACCSVATKYMAAAWCTRTAQNSEQCKQS